jgi:hypothetical protein
MLRIEYWHSTYDPTSGQATACSRGIGEPCCTSVGHYQNCPFSPFPPGRVFRNIRQIDPQVTLKTGESLNSHQQPKIRDTSSPWLCRIGSPAGIRIRAISGALPFGDGCSGGDLVSRDPHLDCLDVVFFLPSGVHFGAGPAA